jgi:hypothetical protein
MGFAADWAALPGFRKVRGQVHKRIVRRLRDLELTHIAEYRRIVGTSLIILPNGRC